MSLFINSKPASASTDRLNVLFLADNSHVALSIVDHIAAFTLHSRHRWYVVNPTLEYYATKLDFSLFDAIAIHYSLWVVYDHFLPPPFRKKVKAFRGPKIQFIQDEYRAVHKVCERMGELGISTLFTLVRPDLVEKAYNHPAVHGIRKISTLPGFVPQRLIDYPVLPIAERKLHLAYRSRQVPYWLGDLGQDKVRIAEGVSQRASAYGLTTNIGVRESERIYGEAWVKFLGSAKAVLGTEGGASIWDYTGEVQQKVDGYIKLRPEADFETVAKAVLAPYEGNLMYNTLSPRVFEAAALRTPMVLFPGWYNGVLLPDRHYIALEKDFSNFAKVAAKLKDDRFLQDLADRTYAEIVASGRYTKRSFIETVDGELELAVYKSHSAPVLPESRIASRLNRLRVEWNTTRNVPSEIARRLRLLRAIGRMLKYPLAAYRTFRRTYWFLLRNDYSRKERILILVQESFLRLPSFLHFGVLAAIRIVLPRLLYKRLRETNRYILKRRNRLE